VTGTTWRSPATVLACCSIILMLSLGTRQSFGLFLQPMSMDLGWTRGSFAFAIALQNLLWGALQPFAGMIADRHGATRVTAIAGILYALGLVLMAHAETTGAFGFSAGVLVGLGLSGSAFGVIMAAAGRAVPAEKRGFALGVVGAGGSFGQFIMLPYGQWLIGDFGWFTALLVLAAGSLLIIPLAAGLATRPPTDTREQSLRQALTEAAAHRGFWLLTLSFLVCGFQTTFMMVHLPAYLVDQGLSPQTGMMALALVMFFNIVGSYACGALGDRYVRKYLLSGIYALRAIAIAAFLLLPVSIGSVVLFAVAIGLGWLGTVPLTNGLVAHIFGVRYLATLFSITFFGHQIGSFLGVWFGGYAFDITGSYTAVWLICLGASIVAALLCLPIDERRISAAPASQPAT
jgi:MFS family permease